MPSPIPHRPPRRLPLPALALLALICLLPALAAAPADGAKPPLPRANPDRAFATPVMADPATSPRAAGGATVSANRICPQLRRLARRGNSRAGLQVRNLKNGKVVCGLNPSTMRSLASNTKIFTTVTALARLGPDHRVRTRLHASGRLDRQGTLHGNLFLRGGGDPSLGTESFLSTYLAGTGSPIEKLAAKAKRAGISKVTGRLFADDTVFDRLRGVADSGYGTSPWIGPLSGLSFNAGFTNSSLSRFSSNPARLAAKSLARAMRARGIQVKAEVGMRKTPAAARKRLIARQIAPDMTWMSRVTNLNSNNFFAEMTLKNVGAAIRGSGTTRAGAVVVKRYAASQGVKVNPVDGSGLTISNRSNPKGVVRLLIRAHNRPWGQKFVDSLPVAGRDGTLASRMRGSAAEGRCHAKTGTLTGVSALSGYCFNSSGRQYAFSILMNGVGDSYSARAAQDAIAALIARL